MSLLKRQIANVAVAGERERGSDGVVLVRQVNDENEISWTKLSDVKPVELQDKLADLLTEEGELYVFVAQVENNDKVHVWKMTRAEMLSFDSQES